MDKVLRREGCPRIIPIKKRTEKFNELKELSNSDELIDILDVILIVSTIIEGEPECDDGCNNTSDSCIDIHSVFKQFDALEIDSNGYYHFSYSPTGQSESDYGTVYYMTTDPVTRVGWSSPDSFYVYHMGQIFWEPVINYSTYSGDDGEGQQLFYVNPTLISLSTSFRVTVNVTSVMI